MEAIHVSSPVLKELFDWQKSVPGQTDFEIELQDCTIPCHKCVLSESSHYFNAMFLSSMKESLTDRVRLEDTSTQSFSVLLKFAYSHDSQKLDIDTENIFDVTSAASMYQFRTALEICQVYLVEIASAGAMWADILVFSEVHALENARHAALRYILYYFNQELKRKKCQFLQLPRSQVHHILAHPRLNCRSEMDVAIALDRWNSHEDESRTEFFAELFLAVVRLSDITLKELRQLLNLSTIQKDSNTRKLVLDKIGSLESSSIEQNDQCQHDDERRIRRSRSGPFVLLSVGGEVVKEEITSPCLDIYQVDAENASMKIYASLNRLFPTCGINVGYRSCSLGKDLFVTGGEAVLGRNTWNLDIWKLDSFTRTWSCVTHLMQPRRHHGICVLDNALILIGGMGRFRQILSSVEKYDTVKNEWTSLCSLKRSEFWPAAAVCRRRIYIVKNSIQRYDPETDQWTIVSIELPFNLGFHSAISVGDSIYMKCQYDGRLVRLRPHSDVDQAVTVGEFSECSDGQLVIHRDAIFVLGGPNSSDNMQYFDLVSRTFETVGKPAHNIVAFSLALLPDYSGEL